MYIELVDHRTAETVAFAEHRVGPRIVGARLYIGKYLYRIVELDTWWSGSNQALTVFVERLRACVHGTEWKEHIEWTKPTQRPKQRQRATR